MVDHVLATLTALREQAGKMVNPLHPEFVAAGMRYAIDEVERALTGGRDRLVGPGEASKISGYSKRQLRRLVIKGRLTNYGRWRSPLYRVGELPLKPGHRTAPEPKAEIVIQQASSLAGIAAQGQVPALGAVDHTPVPIPTHAARSKPGRRGGDAAIEARAKEKASRRRQTRVA
jgi:hypothetical protein